MSTTSVPPPSYTSSPPLPSYSTDLTYGERRLEHTPRSSASFQRPNSVYLKRAGKVTITLNEQESGTPIPIYGRSSLISGSISLESREDVLDVVTYVEGKLETTSSEGGGGTYRLIKDRYKVWSRPSASKDVCPGELAFAYLLPSHFKHKNEELSLPPSYLQYFSDLPTVFVKVSYQLRFIITRVRYQNLGIWNKTKRVVIPFTYSPRTRAYRPILPNPSFFSSVKTSPEEWYQAVTCLKTRANVKMDPIHCHIFIPAGRVYGLKDIIPFHVQVSADTCVLSEFFSSRLDRVMSADTCNTANFRNENVSKPLLRVYLVRQVLIDKKSVTSWRTTELGEGVISPIPPAFSTHSDGCRERQLDWQGEVRCRQDIDVGSFSVMHAHIKDFLTLCLSPPRDRPSPVLDLRISIPIKFVTDSFSDLTFMDTAAA